MSLGDVVRLEDPLHALCLCLRPPNTKISGKRRIDEVRARSARPSRRLSAASSCSAAGLPGPGFCSAGGRLKLHYLRHNATTNYSLPFTKKELGACVEPPH